MPPSKFSRRDSFSPARSIVAMTSSLRDIHIDYETMLIDSIATDTTAYCTKPHWAASVLLPVRAGRSTKYLTPGQRVIVRWEDGYGQRRFIDAGSRLGKLLEDGESNIYSQWLRVGARASYRWYVPDWDDPEAEETSITFASGSGLELQDGSIVRTSADGILYWADGNNLCHLSLSAPTEDPVVTDLGAEIIAMSLCELSSRSYSITQTYVEGDATPDYTAGINAAEALFAEGGAFYENEGDPCSQGYNDCIGELGYRAVELADAYLLGDYAPPEGESEDFVNGWIDGFKAYFKANYDPCYEGGGCTIPEG